MKAIKYTNQVQIRKGVSHLYCNAFPRNERPPVKYFFSIANKRSNKLFAFYDNDEFIGFTLLVFYKDYCYISYLATSENKRNKGYGSKILSMIKEEYKNYKIFLLFEEVDIKYKDYSNREKRHQFYLKNGFIDNDLKTEEYFVIYQCGSIGKFHISFEDYKHVFIANYGRWALKYLKRPS